VTSILLILSLLSLDVGRSRTTVTTRSIERTLVRIGAGLAQSYGDEANLATLCAALEGEVGPVHIREPRLHVDGQRTGFAVCRVAKAIGTIALFLADRSSPGDSVELRYTMFYHGLSISRQVTITEGQIVSRASFSGPMGPQGRLRAVWLTVAASESARGTTITTAATARLNSAICPHRSTSRFQVVNRLAGRAVARQLDSVLHQAESECRQLSADGHELLMGSVSRFADRLLTWKR
jgi:hypothetical protein